jgi:glycosyltransferase involved in cell wall biosynthesis
MLNTSDQFPKITIITPTFNQGNYIEESILSVLNQNYPNLEYIIIDGGSTDETVSIIKKYEEKIDFWLSEPDAGQTDAINKGFAKATGEIINWLNSDDYLEPECLKLIATEFCVNKEAICVTGYVRNFQESGLQWVERLHPQEDSLNYLVNSYNNQPGTFFRKSYWETIFPLPTDLHYTMDQYIWICFWLIHSPNSLIISDFTINNFRRHPQSKTESLYNENLSFKNLSEAFFNEYHSLFSSLYFDDKCKIDVLNLYVSTVSKKISYPIELLFCLTNKVKAQVFSEYLLSLILEDYNKNCFRRLKQTIVNINPQDLRPSSLIKLNMMKKKLPYLYLMHFYRKVYWKLKGR